ncbi:MAG: class I SAM-dependent methyltransferase [Planctomycetes bacterium]|nr:class I SAM-dependent methyltransferase [Planctomycetota bacterium]
MPTIEWNQRWKRDLEKWTAEGQEQPFGYQWGDPDQMDCLREVRERFLLPYVDPGATALEIGCGGGRWTRDLLGFGRLYCVDIHAEMFHYLLERFGPQAHVSFVRSTGSDLPSVPARSLDFVFSFGTFVHLDPPLVEEYLRNLAPLLRPYAHVVIQYSDKRKPRAAGNPGFAPMDVELMHALLARTGFAVEEEQNETLPHSNIVRARLARAGHPLRAVR